MDKGSELEEVILQGNRISFYSSHEKNRFRPGLANNNIKRGRSIVNREKLSFAEKALISIVVQALLFQLSDRDCSNRHYSENERVFIEVEIG